MYVIGITGGIASGKSTVTKQIQSSKGIHTIDVDKLGHSCYDIGSPCYTKVVEEFGTEVLSDDSETIDRRALGRLVFGNKKNMKRLTDIVWPEIFMKLRNELQNCANAGLKVVVVEAAVIIEAGWTEVINELWLVAVPKDIALDRLMRRNSLSSEEALKRINSQTPQEKAMEVADRVIWNTGNIAKLQDNVNQLWDTMPKDIIQ